MSTKQKTINGIIWSFAERFLSQFVTLFVSILLARILSPKEFGIVAMLAIFIGISNVFIFSGFNQALIRKINCSKDDYTTVFYFNLFVSIIFYAILFFTSGLISSFYNEPVLERLIKVLGLALVINAVSIIQQTIITKRVDFKLLTKITIISAVCSGLVGIGLALAGYGVWSLIYKQLSYAVCTAGLLWCWNKWRPNGRFNKESLAELWKFSGNLFVLGLVDAIYKNLYLVIIGKFYPASDLGQYQQAETFKKLPSETLANVISRVSFPVLSSMQDDASKIQNAFIRLQRSTVLLSSILLVGIASVSREIVLVLMGEEWKQAGEYLQIIAFAGIFYPLIQLCFQVLKVVNRSDLILKIGILLKLFSIPVILTAIFIGIKEMLFCAILYSIISYVVVAYKTGLQIELKWIAQIKSLIPTLSIVLSMFVFLCFLDLVIGFNPLEMLLLKIVAGGIYLTIIFELFKYDDYCYIKKIVLDRIMPF